jgi:superfamily II RNA helicase
VDAPPLDVDSQIKIDFSMVLNLLLSHSPEEIRTLLDKSFASYLIAGGQKGSKIARKKFGNDMEHLWLDFQDHMAFLTQEAYVTPDGALTEDGLWASKLRIDSPLLVAQSIRQDLLPIRDPALLASIIGTFVNEKEFTDDPLRQSALPKRLKGVFLDLRYGLKPFAIKLLKKGFPAPNLYIQPAALLYSWAHGEDWDDLMAGSVFAEGDFARLILRTAENLRQIAKLEDTFPQIARTAKEAIELILKEPIVTLYN